MGTDRISIRDAIKLAYADPSVSTGYDASIVGLEHAAKVAAAGSPLDGVALSFGPAFLLTTSVAQHIEQTIMILNK